MRNPSGKRKTTEFEPKFYAEHKPHTYFSKNVEWSMRTYAEKNPLCGMRGVSTKPCFLQLIPGRDNRRIPWKNPLEELLRRIP